MYPEVESKDLFNKKYPDINDQCFMMGAGARGVSIVHVLMMVNLYATITRYDDRVLISNHS